MKDEDVSAIRKLDKAKLDPREYTALCWVDEFLTYPSGVTRETDELFNDTFSEKDRLRIIATMKTMFMANLMSNTFESVMNKMAGVDDRKREVACSI
ncbi:MAG: hypothetical protein JXA49_03515 [Actinobacteria bacterium]|nr:hypothetical protein [Actinomycetota bacterium]